MPTTGDCDCNPNYGPHIRQVRDTTGHEGTIEVQSSPEHPLGWPTAVCTCGWRDFPTNWYEHLEKVARLVTVYS